MASLFEINKLSNIGSSEYIDEDFWSEDELFEEKKESQTSWRSYDNLSNAFSITKALVNSNFNSEHLIKMQKSKQDFKEVPFHPQSSKMISTGIESTSQTKQRSFNNKLFNKESARRDLDLMVPQNEIDSYRSISNAYQGQINSDIQSKVSREFKVKTLNSVKLNNTIRKS